jgi:hypothetical protein
MQYTEFNNNKIVIEFEETDSDEDKVLMRQAILFVKVLLFRIIKQ